MKMCTTIGRSDIGVTMMDLEKLFFTRHSQRTFSDDPQGMYEEEEEEDEVEDDEEEEEELTSDDDDDNQIGLDNVIEGS